ncbi:hypothetical protein DSO57_1023130 [Entomophthora muscae]|uniref:Uncharacterized protein n=1 Tax=Entomophthora muscae TaxID=34485 RepID=A0ACC2UNT3_9FUNG|nr:hypothetical protein DSO57_1023130 [Entomophthora muscae]
MRLLEKLLKDLNSAVSEIKENDLKVKEKFKSAVLTGNKVNKVSMMALMTKMPDTSEETIKCLLNVQKTVVKGLQFKMSSLSTLSVWVNDPEMYEHLKHIKSSRTFRAQNGPDKTLCCIGLTPAVEQFYNQKIVSLIT